MHIKTANFCMQASRQNYINTPQERKNDVCLYFTVYLTLPGMICLHSQQEVFFYNFETKLELLVLSCADIKLVW